MNGRYFKYILNFKNPSGTSRGILKQKETWFIEIENEGKKGIGECGVLRGLSIDDRPDYESKLKWVCNNIHLDKEILLAETKEFPSIQIGLETALLSFQADNPYILFPSDFTESKENILINGLVWMGDPKFMLNQIEQKITAGFSCIKMKIGALDFNQELSILSSIRQRFTKDEIIIRVDANGSFSPNDALKKIELLAQYDIHSIEQPIKAGQWKFMHDLCKQTPLPIALDEELIGVFDKEKKEELLATVKPQFIILKPSFIGGFRGSEEWISIASKHNIGWWVTSALESNIGLNAIAQWTKNINYIGHQGLGTGSLYSNNIESPLYVKNGYLGYEKTIAWGSIKKTYF